GEAFTSAVEQTRGVSLETKTAVATASKNLIGVLGLILLAPFLLGSLPGATILNGRLPLPWPFQLVLSFLLGLLLFQIRWHVVGLLTRSWNALLGGSLVS